MPQPTTVAVLLIASYLVGAIPFGYLIGRLRGVDLFQVGSGNIGATNAGRMLGRKIGMLVFVLDFFKGAIPVAAIVPLAEAIAPGSLTNLGSPDVLRVGAAALAFLGHLYPVYLGFHGGKGIATGTGAVFVLVPEPAALGVLTFVTLLLSFRIVSFASLVAATVLLAARLTGTHNPFDIGHLPVTLFLLAATGMTFFKHRGNIRRLVAGTENQIEEFNMRGSLVCGLHVLALGLWFGGAAFFNFIAAVPIFRSFEQVVNDGPSDRTAGETIISADASTERKKALASALAGSAVGPVFPRYFAMQAVCAVIALATALSWWKSENGRRIHRVRVMVIAAAAVTVAIGWPISSHVSQLRLERFAADSAAASAARAAFGTWHLASLMLSTVTVGLAGVALALAARMPTTGTPAATVPTRS